MPTFCQYEDCRNEATEYVILNVNDSIAVCDLHSKEVVDGCKWRLFLNRPPTKFPVSVKVKQDYPEIQEVYVITCNEDSVILQVNSKTKYLQPEGYLGTRTILYPKRVELTINVPFKNAVLFTEPGRYEHFVTVFNKRLLDDLVYGGDSGQTIFEAEPRE